MKEENPIIEEIQRTREAMLAKFGGDFDALYSDLKRKEADRALGGHPVISPDDRNRSVQPEPIGDLHGLQEETTSDENPIIEEIHQTRAAMLAEFGGDLNALFRDLQRSHEERAQAGWPVRSPADRVKKASVPTDRKNSRLAKGKPRRRPSQPA